MLFIKSDYYDYALHEVSFLRQEVAFVFPYYISIPVLL